MNLEEMRNKIGPWMPAVFCSALAVIVTIGNIWAASVGGSDNAVTLVFILFMPMCFFFVGIHLTELKKENAELRERLEEIEPPFDEATAGSVDRPGHENAEQDSGGQPATRPESK
jgi:hypothetical protein